MRFFEKHAAREKFLRCLEREADRLHHAQSNAPVVPLEQPYQRGWVKTYVLRDDVPRRPDADGFRAALKIVNQRVYARTRAFTDRNDEPLLLQPRIIPAREWRASALPASHQRFFGLGHWIAETALHWRFTRWQHHIFGYKLVSDWWLVETIQPHLITHQRVELPKVRSRLAEIEAYMAAHHGWDRLGRLHGRSQWWKRCRLSVHERRAKNSIHDYIQ